MTQVIDAISDLSGLEPSSKPVVFMWPTSITSAASRQSSSPSLTTMAETPKTSRRPTSFCSACRARRRRRRRLSVPAGLQGGERSARPPHRASSRDLRRRPDAPVRPHDDARGARWHPRSQARQCRGRRRAATPTPPMSTRTSSRRVRSCAGSVLSSFTLKTVPSRRPLKRYCATTSVCTPHLLV